MTSIKFGEKTTFNWCISMNNEVINDFTDSHLSIDIITPTESKPIDYTVTDYISFEYTPDLLGSITFRCKFSVISQSGREYIQTIYWDINVLSDIENDTYLRERFTDINDIRVDLNNYYTKSEIDNKGYYDTIPDEYITSLELAHKNYATKEDILLIEDKFKKYYTKSEIENKGYVTPQSTNFRNSLPIINGSGTNSAILNYADNQATGSYSFAAGKSCICSGAHSFAVGSNNTASGTCSVAQGINTTASGPYTHAEGERTKSIGNNSHAEGYGTSSMELWSHSEGYNSEADGQASHAEGYGTTSHGNYSHAEGRESNSYGPVSHAEGYLTRANGNNSHSEGNGTTAGGNNSHAEGNATKANGINSHAEGVSTNANGYCSHTEGVNTIANGAYAHAEGFYTQANNTAELACGKYNLSKTDNEDANLRTIFSVGFGDGENNRKNAIEVRETGEVFVYVNYQYVSLTKLIEGLI